MECAYGNDHTIILHRLDAASCLTGQLSNNEQIMFCRIWKVLLAIWLYYITQCIGQKVGFCTFLAITSMGNEKGVSLPGRVALILIEMRPCGLIKKEGWLKKHCPT